MEFNILYWFQSIHNSFLDHVMIGFTTLGNGGTLWILLTLLFLCTKKYRKCGITMGIALVFSLIMCNGVMKNLVARSRPCWIDNSIDLLVKMPKDYSFPSGHTSASFAAAIAIFAYHKREGVAALVIAALISISRLYLFVHFPSDVLTSMILGSIYGVLSFQLVKFVCARFGKVDKWLNPVNI